MKRITTTPRSDWQSRVEAIGFDFHTDFAAECPYWDESAYYEFSAAEVDMLEECANELAQMCQQVVKRVINERLYGMFGIPKAAIPVIERDWTENAPTLYGRFDIAWNGTSFPKMLEFNADTPTSLFEAAVVQWYWMEDMRESGIPDADQFNSLHESLVERWRQIRRGRYGFDKIHLACATPSLEDECTTRYLMATAIESGLRAKFLSVQDLGWDAQAGIFRDLENDTIDRLFKLYPLEWLVHDMNNNPQGVKIDFAACKTRFIEPAWRMILSNKALLALLWDTFPGHKYLLPTSFNRKDIDSEKVVRKALLGREGANVTIFEGDKISAQTGGTYGQEGFIYQKHISMPAFDGNHPVLGLWLVGDESHGMGIREDVNPITGNTSRFIPHLFREDR